MFTSAETKTDPAHDAARPNQVVRAFIVAKRSVERKKKRRSEEKVTKYIFYLVSLRILSD